MPDQVSFPPIVTLPQQRVQVDADGTFTLPLPTNPNAAIDTYRDDGCVGDVTESAPAARFEELYHLKLMLYRDGALLGSARSRRVDGTTSREIEFIYATVDTDVTGTQACAYDGRRETFDLRLKAGWNNVRLTIRDYVDWTFENAPDDTVAWY